MVVLAGSDAAAAAGIDVGELYAGQAAHVRRLVRWGVRAPDPVIDDACQTAWSRLVSHRGRVGADTAVAWLVTTARREAMRLIRWSERDLSLEEVLECTGEASLPSAPALEDTVELRARIASVHELVSERQERLVWLQALGFSYPEMAGRVQATPRTIDRQLVRARHRLRAAAE